MGLDRRGCVVQPKPRANRRREELVDTAKPFDIPKREVWEAFKRVLDGEERSADATTMTECELLVLNRRDFCRSSRITPISA